MKAKAVFACVLCGLVLGFTSTAHADDDMVENPQYKLWAQFKPGTFVVTRTNTKFKDIASTTTSKMTLLEVTPEKVVLSVEISVDLGGSVQNNPPQKLEFKAKVKKSQLPAADKAEDDPKAKKGKETLTIGGEKVETEWIETVTENKGVKTRVKKWHSDKVPTKLVKMESETMTKPPHRSEMIVAKFEVKK